MQFDPHNDHEGRTGPYFVEPDGLIEDYMGRPVDRDEAIDIAMRVLGRYINTSNGQIEHMQDAWYRAVGPKYDR